MGNRTSLESKALENASARDFQQHLNKPKVQKHTEIQVFNKPTAKTTTKI